MQFPLIHLYFQKTTEGGRNSALSWNFLRHETSKYQNLLKILSCVFKRLKYNGIWETTRKGIKKIFQNLTPSKDGERKKLHLSFMQLLISLFEEDENFLQIFPR